MLGLLFLSPHLLATSSGSTNLNSPFVPSQVMYAVFAESDNSSRRNCHNWICPDPENRKKQNIQIVAKLCIKRSKYPEKLINVRLEIASSQILRCRISVRCNNLPVGIDPPFCVKLASRIFAYFCRFSKLIYINRWRVVH